MDKKRAIDKLIRLISDLEQIPTYSVDGSNPEFDKWYNDTEIALGHIFVDDQGKHVKPFKGLRWGPSVYSTATPDSDFIEAHRHGRDRAHSLLEAFRDEINDFWEETLVQPPRSSNDRIDDIRNLIHRFHSIARQLRIRYNNRATIQIKDEYDVQDVFAALLRIQFDDIRSEEYTPSYAGRASRIDFLVKDNKVAIEVKKTREGLLDKEVGEQLLIDIGRYSSHPDVEVLLCFVYDPEGLLRNPHGIETDLTKVVGHLNVEVIVEPKF